MIKRTSQLGLLALFSLLLPTQAALADAMQCGRKLVSDGDSMYDVRSRCGEPDMVRTRVKLRTVVNHVNGPCVRTNGVLRCGTDVATTEEIPIEEWTYDFGPHQFVRTVVFVDGKLHEVRTGRYGSKRS